VPLEVSIIVPLEVSPELLRIFGVSGAGGGGVIVVPIQLVRRRGEMIIVRNMRIWKK
jgi:hypothetical protein